ncbi:MAG: 3-hydroxybutyryl-CoA dehydrogenase [Desulfobacteraceae bacterium]|nr:MAG: 3-hydroxybutyryl-CoA dehydrogenase [Desulfobacteraceae bacterium]
MKTVGVVGAGIMGAGIAHTCAQAGYSVVISDVSREVLDRGLKVVTSSLNKAVEKRKISSKEMDSILGRIKKTTELKEFAVCDLVIEAVTEDLELKKKIFAQLDAICPPHSILATNTSVLSVTDIAIMTKRPEKVLGMHFANPVPVMKILEMVKTLATDDETISISRAFGESIGKRIVMAKDAAGFVSNRILTPFLLNSIRMLESGFASAEDIDTLHTLGLGHPMGPLALLDLIGIDTVYRGASAIYDELKDPQYNPPTLMRKMVAIGWHGRKAGRGFYVYEKKA